MVHFRLAFGHHHRRSDEEGRKSFFVPRVAGPGPFQMSEPRLGWLVGDGVNFDGFIIDQM